MSRGTNKQVLQANAEQRRVLSSPIRLEILGQFTSPGGMSVAEVARRIGRSTGSLYYHFQIMETVGLLKRVGSRPRTKREEALFEPTASRIEFPAECDSASSVRTVLKTMSSAFRMAERDLEAALLGGTARTTGKYRNLFAARMHVRLSKATLAEINQHIRAIEKILYKEARRKKLPPDADQHCSLTLALLPLRGREQE